MCRIFFYIMGKDSNYVMFLLKHYTIYEVYKALSFNTHDFLKFIKKKSYSKKDQVNCYATERFSLLSGKYYPYSKNYNYNEMLYIYKT